MKPIENAELIDSLADDNKKMSPESFIVFPDAQKETITTDESGNLQIKKENAFLHKLILDRTNPKNCDQYFIFNNGPAIWQNERYGPPLEKKLDRELYRAYVMLPSPADLPKTLDIIRSIAQVRKNRDQTTNFKWIVSNLGDNPDIFQSDRIDPSIVKGVYRKVDNKLPMIAFYADNLKDIIGLLNDLVMTNPGYREYFKKLTKKREGLPRRPGTNAFRDKNGWEFRMFCYHDKPGFSEDEVRKYKEQGKDWRDDKQGNKTIVN